MAKYTELLAEYIEGGGVLPSSSFALISGFEDLFKERFCNCEIGFETEAIFALKLDMKARLVMPIYAEKIAVMLEEMTGLKNNPVKMRYETRAYGKMHSSNKTDGSNTDLPFDADDATPSALSHLEGSADNDAHTDNLTFSEGLSADERLRIIEAINRKAFILTEECLEEFKPLFMGVY